MSNKHHSKRCYSVIDQEEYDNMSIMNPQDDILVAQTVQQNEFNDQQQLTSNGEAFQNKLKNSNTCNNHINNKQRCMVVFGLGVVLGIAFGILLGHLACKNNQGTSLKGQNITRNLSAESYAYRQPPGNEKPKVDKCVLEQWSDVFIPNTTLIKNRCDFGSAFVKEYCNEDKSRHRCQQCGKYMIPKSCFCDTEIQCNYNGFKADNPIKKTCGECRKELNCPCINGGNCTCNDETATADTIHCECPRGHTGQYCDVTIQTEVRYRICAPSTNNAETICDGAEIDACTIFSTYFNQNITCVTTKDEFEIKKLKKCS